MVFILARHYMERSRFLVCFNSCDFKDNLRKQNLTAFEELR